MKQYDGKVNFGALGEKLKREGYEYAHLEEVYMKVFGKSVPESKKPNIKENGKEIYYPDSEDSEENEELECASLLGTLL